MEDYEEIKFDSSYRLMEAVRKLGFEQRYRVCEAVRECDGDCTGRDR